MSFAKPWLVIDELVRVVTSLFCSTMSVSGAYHPGSGSTETSAPVELGK